VIDSWRSLGREARPVGLAVLLVSSNCVVTGDGLVESVSEHFTLVYFLFIVLLLLRYLVV